MSTVGSVLAEFAGTRDEAKAFAKKHRVRCAQNLGLSSNALPYLSIRFNSHAKCEAACTRFDKLGWDRDSVIITLPGKRVKTTSPRPGAGP